MVPTIPYRSEHRKRRRQVRGPHPLPPGAHLWGHIPGAAQTNHAAGSGGSRSRGGRGLLDGRLGHGCLAVDRLVGVRPSGAVGIRADAPGRVRGRGRELRADRAHPHHGVSHAAATTPGDEPDAVPGGVDDQVDDVRLRRLDGEAGSTSPAAHPTRCECSRAPTVVVHRRAGLLEPAPLLGVRADDPGLGADLHTRRSDMSWPASVSSCLPTGDEPVSEAGVVSVDPQRGVRRVRVSQVPLTDRLRPPGIERLPGEPRSPQVTATGIRSPHLTGKVQDQRVSFCGLTQPQVRLGEARGGPAQDLVLPRKRGTPTAPAAGSCACRPSARRSRPPWCQVGRRPRRRPGASSCAGTTR